MTDTTASDIQQDDAEKHYGHIPDRLAWDLPLGGTVTTDSGFQVFTGRFAPESKRAEALARTPEMGLYRVRYRAGGGENGLHSHPGDSIWMVLSGAVRFYAEKSRLVADLGPGGGVMIPSEATYRFQCSEDSELVRFAGPPPPPRAEP
ncbi:cupin domain-containing protein [Jatrophihabitans sp. DSM 45814]